MIIRTKKAVSVNLPAGAALDVSDSVAARLMLDGRFEPAAEPTETRAKTTRRKTTRKEA